MESYRVEFSPESASHVQTIQAWWLANREKNPGLFIAELRAALRQLRRLPRSGARYDVAGVESLRRVLLPKTGCHVYYRLDEVVTVVRIYAVWHAARGAGPRR